MGRCRKAPQGAFLLIKYLAMIHFLDPEKINTNRNYLCEWLSEPTLVITENDLADKDRTHTLLAQHPMARRIFDITHNPAFHDHMVPAEHRPVLTNNFHRWYEPLDGFVYFPVFLWMFSSRNPQWWAPLCFDAGSNKTREMMCLNSTVRSHRTQLWAELNRREIIHKIAYSFRAPCAGTNYPYPYPLTLPNDSTYNTEQFMGLDHEVYWQCAVNLVTDTNTDISCINEKICKPFLARQIPVLVSKTGINQFLCDIGLDMFDDLVPWRTWDQEPLVSRRVAMIAEFVNDWIRSGTILSDYQQVLPRIEKNKEYFHSQKFRDTVMCQMTQAKL